LFKCFKIINKNIKKELLGFLFRILEGYFKFLKL
jgi:hypothetical protein